VTPTNIAYVHSHDTGRWVQPYVHRIRRDREIRRGTGLDLVPAVPS